MKFKSAAALWALLLMVGFAQAAGKPTIHQVQLKSGGPGFLLTCEQGIEACQSLGPRLCPGKTALWSDSKGTFSNVPVTMRKNGSTSLMVVKCE